MIRRETRRRPRIGFTLIELMVVIVIIGILVGLLLPVIIGAVKKTREAVITADIQLIAAGLGKFKDTYGEFPPSRVILSESGVYSASSPSSAGNGSAVGPFPSDFTTALSAYSYIGTLQPVVGVPDISYGELASRSLRILRKMYPRAFLGPVGNTFFPVASSFFRYNGYFPDFNGNGVLDSGTFYLEGDECLVFFLGGIPLPSTTGTSTASFGTTGFGKDPIAPFSNAGLGATIESSSNRANPLFEFKPDRLADDDGDGMPGYLDPNASKGLGAYYAYFASYGAAGYDPNDCNYSDNSDPTIGNTFRMGLPLFGGPVPPNTASVTPNPYTSSLPTPPSAAQPASYINPNSFQIISAGADGLFGYGGQWVSAGDHLPLNGLSTRDAETDNLSNFTAGRMGN